MLWVDFGIDSQTAMEFGRNFWNIYRFPLLISFLAVSVTSLPLGKKFCNRISRFSSRSSRRRRGKIMQWTVMCCCNFNVFVFFFLLAAVRRKNQNNSDEVNDSRREDDNWIPRGSIFVVPHFLWMRNWFSLWCFRLLLIEQFRFSWMNFYARFNGCISWKCKFFIATYDTHFWHKFARTFNCISGSDT